MTLAGVVSTSHPGHLNTATSKDRREIAAAHAAIV